MPRRSAGPFPIGAYGLTEERDLLMTTELPL